MAKTIDRVVVATSDDPSDDDIARLVESLDIDVYRGSLDDVLTRFVGAVDTFPVDAVARVTADCPLLDPRVIDEVVGRWREEPTLDYVSTTNPRCLPRGLDAEVASVAALRQADAEAVGTDRSHVTSYLYRAPGRFKSAGVVFQPDASDLRVTLDTEQDFDLLSKVARDLGNRIIPHEELIEYLRTTPDTVALNSNVQQKSIDEA